MAGSTLARAVLRSATNMSIDAGHFEVRVEPVDGFEFRIKFDREHHPDIITDEPTPLGRDLGPNPSRLLAAAIGNSLASSLLFCLKRAGAAPGVGVGADVDVDLTRDEFKRLRIGQVRVTLRPSADIDPGTMSECLSTFEDYCVVAQSVRAGLDVQVEVAEPYQPGLTVDG